MGSKPIECENREREEHLAQVAEEAARLRGGGVCDQFGLLCLGVAFPIVFSFVRHLKGLNLTALGCGVTTPTHP